MVSSSSGASALFILRLVFSALFDAAPLNSVNFAVTAGLCGLWVLVDSLQWYWSRRGCGLGNSEV